MCCGFRFRFRASLFSDWSLKKLVVSVGGEPRRILLRKSLRRFTIESNRKLRYVSNKNLPYLLFFGRRRHTTILSRNIVILIDQVEISSNENFGNSVVGQSHNSSFYWKQLGKRRSVESRYRGITRSTLVIERGDRFFSPSRYSSDRILKFFFFVGWDVFSTQTVSDSWRGIHPQNITTTTVVVVTPPS